MINDCCKAEIQPIYFPLESPRHAILNPNESVTLKGEIYLVNRTDKTIDVKLMDHVPVTLLVLDFVNPPTDHTNGWFEKYGPKKLNLHSFSYNSSYEIREKEECYFECWQELYLVPL